MRGQQERQIGVVDAEALVDGLQQIIDPSPVSADTQTGVCSSM